MNPFKLNLELLFEMEEESPEVKQDQQKIKNSNARQRQIDKSIKKQKQALEKVKTASKDITPPSRIGHFTKEVGKDIGQKIKGGYDKTIGSATRPFLHPVDAVMNQVKSNIQDAKKEGELHDPLARLQAIKNNVKRQMDVKGEFQNIAQQAKQKTDITPVTAPIQALKGNIDKITKGSKFANLKLKSKQKDINNKHKALYMLDMEHKKGNIQPDQYEKEKNNILSGIKNSSQDANNLYKNKIGSETQRKLKSQQSKMKNLMGKEEKLIAGKNIKKR